MSLPEVIFGKCPVCGGGGKDDSDSGSAFSTEDHAGEGYELVYYQGKAMCKMCRKRLMAYAEDDINSAKRNEEEAFLKKCGVKQEMED